MIPRGRQDFPLFLYMLFFPFVFFLASMVSGALDNPVALSFFVTGIVFEILAYGYLVVAEYYRSKYAGK